MSRGFFVNFKVPEIKEVLADLSKYDARTTRKIEEQVSKSTKAIGKGARDRVSVKSGKLKKSIRTSFDVKKVEGTISAKEFYAHFIEFGVKMHDVPAPFKKAWTDEKPYMRPSTEDERPKFIRGVTEAVKP